MNLAVDYWKDSFPYQELKSTFHEKVVSGLKDFLAFAIKSFRSMERRTHATLLLLLSFGMQFRESVEV